MSFENYSDVTISDVISHFHTCEGHDVFLMTSKGEEYPITLGSDENSEYEIIFDNDKRLKTIQDILNELGIEESPEGEFFRITISIDAYWNLI